MNSYTTAAPCRNALDGCDDLPLFAYRPAAPDHRDFTRGGFIVHRRTRWSPALCNAVAALAGLGHAEG